MTKYIIKVSTFNRRQRKIKKVFVENSISSFQKNDVFQEEVNDYLNEIHIMFSA